VRQIEKLAPETHRRAAVPEPGRLLIFLKLASQAESPNDILVHRKS
jgi:hypothetical protein